MNDIELKFQKQKLRNERIKQLKEKENGFSKELVSLYKNKKDEIDQEVKDKEIYENYKKLVEEIESLETQKNKIMDQFQKSKKDNEQQNKIFLDFLETIEEKQKQFKVFMQDKGKKALEYFKKKKKEEDSKYEEIHKIKQKKMVKEVENNKEREIAKKYKEYLENNDLEEDQVIDPKALYKKTQIYHPYGNNRIDYTNSRFHSIVVVKHGDELIKHITANEKAAEETNKTEIRLKSKEKSLEKFKRETSSNGYELQKKLKARENLKKLEDNLKKIRMKTSTPNINKIKPNKEFENNQNNNQNESMSIDRRLEILNKFSNNNEAFEDENIKNIMKTYNEPITRESYVKEYVHRLNPVDIKEYLVKKENELESNNNQVIHKEQVEINKHDLYSMKDIENILNVDHLFNKNEKGNQINNEIFQDSNRITIGKKEKDILGNNKVAAVGEKKSNKKEENQDDINSIINIVNTKKTSKEMLMIRRKIHKMLKTL